MNPMVKRAQEAVQTQEVQDMIRRLSEYGLGVFMPHMHHEESGDYVPLPAGVAQVERNLQISFEPETPDVQETCSAVGWRWDDELKVVARCVWCSEGQKGHTKFSH